MLQNTPFVGTPATIEGYTLTRKKITAPLGAGIFVKIVGGLLVQATSTDSVYGLTTSEVVETSDGFFQGVITSGECYSSTTAGTLVGVVELGTQALLNYDGTPLNGFLVKIN